MKQNNAHKTPSLLMLPFYTLLFAGLIAPLFITPSHGHKNHAISKDDHPAIQARHSLMEDSAFAAKQAGAMVTGAAPYDAKKAELTMRLIRSSAQNMAHYFPKASLPSPNSKSESSAKIWQNMKDFQAEINSFKQASQNAVKQASQGADAFKTGFSTVMKSCKSCHQKYRIKKK